MQKLIKELLARFSRWRAKRKHDQEWPVGQQLELLRVIVLDDHQWMGHNPVVDALCKRYRELLSDSWEKTHVEPVSNLRSRLGLDPYR